MFPTLLLVPALLGFTAANYITTGERLTSVSPVDMIVTDLQEFKRDVSEGLFPDEFVEFAFSMTTEDYKDYRSFVEFYGDINDPSLGGPMNVTEFWSRFRYVRRQFHDRVDGVFQRFLARVETLSEKPRKAVEEVLSKMKQDFYREVVEVEHLIRYRDTTRFENLIHTVCADLTYREVLEVFSIFPPKHRFRWSRYPIYQLYTLEDALCFLPNDNHIPTIQHPAIGVFTPAERIYDW